MAQHVGIRLLNEIGLDWSRSESYPTNVARALPAFDDQRYPLLRSIDPYGDTIFSSHQMDGLLAELESRLKETGDASLGEVIAVGERCKARIGSWLIFIGD